LSFISGTQQQGVRLGGEVMLNGRRIDHLRPEKRRVGFMFQSAGLFPHMTAEQNLLFALPSGGGRSERRGKAHRALTAVGASHLVHAYPNAMSGGERSRIALMRTLLAKPRAMLLDEPFSALDRHLRQEIRALTFEAVVSRKLPCLLVTHDDEDAAAANGPVLELK
jgi:putative thiamine transport system ATP-binding protein